MGCWCDGAAAPDVLLRALAPVRGIERFAFAGHIEDSSGFLGTFPLVSTEIRDLEFLGKTPRITHIQAQIRRSTRVLDTSL